MGYNPAHSFRIMDMKPRIFSPCSRWCSASGAGAASPPRYPPLEGTRPHQRHRSGSASSPRWGPGAECGDHGAPKTREYRRSVRTGNQHRLSCPGQGTVCPIPAELSLLPGRSTWRKGLSRPPSRGLRSRWLQPFCLRSPSSETFGPRPAIAPVPRRRKRSSPLSADGPQRTGREQEDFRGRFQLITFGYTACPDICPTTLAEMAAVSANSDPGRIRSSPSSSPSIPSATPLPC